MKLKITKAYCWFLEEFSKRIVIMYFINNMPFTFDELTENEEVDNYIKNSADEHHKKYTPTDMYISSGYLIMEEAHPCFFDVELENPEVLDELD
jgi:hypothetical protein